MHCSWFSSLPRGEWMYVLRDRIVNVFPMHFGLKFTPLFISSVYHCPLGILLPVTWHPTGRLSAAVTALLCDSAVRIRQPSWKCRIAAVSLQRDQLVADRGHIHTDQLSRLSWGTRPLTSTSKSQTNRVIEAAADHTVACSLMWMYSF